MTTFRRYTISGTISLGADLDLPNAAEHIVSIVGDLVVDGVSHGSVVVKLKEVL